MDPRFKFEVLDSGYCRVLFDGKDITSYPHEVALRSSGSSLELHFYFLDPKYLDTERAFLPPEEREKLKAQEAELIEQLRPLKFVKLWNVEPM